MLVSARVRGTAATSLRTHALVEARISGLPRVFKTFVWVCRPSPKTEPRSWVPIYTSKACSASCPCGHLSGKLVRDLLRPRCRSQESGVFNGPNIHHEWEHFYRFSRWAYWPARVWFKLANTVTFVEVRPRRKVPFFSNRRWSQRWILVYFEPPTTSPRDCIRVKVE